MHRDGRLLQSVYTERRPWHIELSNRLFPAMLANTFDEVEEPKSAPRSRIFDAILQNWKGECFRLLCPTKQRLMFDGVPLRGLQADFSMFNGKFA